MGGTTRTYTKEKVKVHEEKHRENGSRLSCASCVGQSMSLGMEGSGRVTKTTSTVPHVPDVYH